MGICITYIVICILTRIRCYSSVPFCSYSMNLCTNLWFQSTFKFTFQFTLKQFIKPTTNVNIKILMPYKHIITNLPDPCTLIERCKSTSQLVTFITGWPSAFLVTKAVNFSAECLTLISALPWWPIWGLYREYWIYSWYADHMHQTQGAGSYKIWSSS